MIFSFPFQEKACIIKMYFFYADGEAALSGRRKKREFLKHTDHRLDMSPVGRNLFVSRDKQAQNRAARRIKVWMRVVITLVIVGAVGAVSMVAVFYLAPWFQSELNVGTGSSGASEASGTLSSLAVPLLDYDEMGLPVYGDDLCLFVVNESSPAEASFSPELAEAEGVQVDARIAAAVRQMASAAKEEGLALVFTEGFVPYAGQERRFDKKVEELMREEGLTTVMAKTEAKALVPAPGESDFQSGLCLRLDGDSATFGKSRTCSWLRTNMGKYGFVFRYPEYKEDYTGVEPDSTVIRYVGSKHAAAMQQRSMCLEEYLSYLASQ